MDIDFVVLWVDGNDPEWRAEKAKYQGAVTDDSNSVNRFRDWGLMPYWFRAVEKFTPWVHKIHFVTCGHVPEFLRGLRSILFILMMICFLFVRCPKLLFSATDNHAPAGKSIR